MSDQTNANKKQKNKSVIGLKDTGSEYHKEHAGNVEGYGEPHPSTKDNIQ